MAKTTLKTPFSDFQARYVALWGTLFFGASILATVLICWLLQFLFPVTAFVSPLLLLIFYGSFGAWLFHFLQKSSVALPTLMGEAPRQWRWGQLIGIVGLLLFFSLGGFLVWSGLRFWIFPQITVEGLEASQIGIADRSWFANALNFLVLVLIAPVVEEVLFRGVLLQRWAVQWGIRPAILVSSFIFGSIHPSNPLGFMVFGLAMALLYVRSRSLLVPIVCHMLNNALAEILRAIAGTPVADQALLLRWVQNSFWQGILIWAIAIPLLVFFVRSTWPRAAAATPYQINLQMGRGQRLRRPKLTPNR